MTTPQEEAYLRHFGVKGMKWGVRKKDDSSSESKGSSESNAPKDPGRFSLKDPKVRRAAMVAGGITLVVAGAFVASRMSNGMKTSEITPETVAKGAEKVEKIFQRPDDIIYLSKAHRESGVTKGGMPSTLLRFVSKGGTDDYFDIFDQAGLNSDDFRPDTMKKMSNGDVAAILGDMMGRVDTAGRRVTHAVLIPADKAVGVNTFEEVVSKFGPELERRYQSFLEAERATST